jgi:hypothetical protein
MTACGREAAASAEALASRACSLAQRSVQACLDRLPALRILELARARQQDVLGRVGILIEAVPGVCQGVVHWVGDVAANGIELARFDVRRERAPSVAVAEKHDEVGLDASALAALDLGEAYFHGALVERSLAADAPAEVDRLEPGAMLLAQCAQPRKDVALEGIALRRQVFKRRTDEDAKGAGGDWHDAGPERR